MNKTPITVLQELMIKLSEVPSYECISQTGPHHMTVFEYRCVAHGVTAQGVARSKKEAKQDAAWRVLAVLAARGHPVPPPYRTAPPISHLTPPTKDSARPLPSSSNDPGDVESGGASAGGAGRLDARSYVTLLKELCEEFRLGAVMYELVGDTGPPHMRMFTVRATLGRHERVATASTKKTARQMAAEQLYTYLRENLASATKDFVENRSTDLLAGQSEPKKPAGGDAAQKSPTKSIEATQESSKKCTEGDAVQKSPRTCTGGDAGREAPRKRKSTEKESEQMKSKRSCDVKTEEETIVKASEDALSRALDKVMSRYVEIREEQTWRPDLGQRIADYHLGEEQREAAAKAAAVESEDSCAVLQETAAALGLTVELTTMPGESSDVSVVVLGPAAPTLALAGRDPPAAARAALRYLRRALQQRPELSPTTSLTTSRMW